MAYTRESRRAAVFMMAFIACGCASAPPQVDGVSATAPAPNSPWTSPAGAIKPEPCIATARASAIPPDLQQRLNQLTLVDVVDLALRNNPATRISWSQARAAADVYGSTRGQFFPTIGVTVSASRTQSLASQGRAAGARTEYGPAVSLNYLLLDLGGRSGSIEEARQNLFAADLTHNATL